VNYSGMLYGKIAGKYIPMGKTTADIEKLQDARGVQEHRIMDLQDRFDNLKVDYAELEKEVELLRAGTIIQTMQINKIEKERGRLHESNNRQSDIIYDLKVQRDELIEYLNCIITRYDNDDSVSGITLDKVRAYLIRIKDSE